jgi:hypothetical protein
MDWFCVVAARSVSMKVMGGDFRWVLQKQAADEAAHEKGHPTGWP